MKGLWRVALCLCCPLALVLGDGNEGAASPVFSRGRPGVFLWGRGGVALESQYRVAEALQVGDLASVKVLEVGR